MVAICYPFHQEDVTPASVSTHQVDIQCFHFNPPSEAAVSQPEVQEAKVSKLKMATEAEDILDKVDNIMGKMIINPTDDLVDIFLRLSNVEDDEMACKLHHWSFEQMHKDEIDATMKLQMDGKISKMKADLEAYQLDMNAKMSAFQLPRDEDTDIYTKNDGEVQAYQEQKSKYCS